MAGTLDHVDGRADLHVLGEPEVVRRPEADAAVRDPPGDRARGVVGPVEAHHAAAGPLAQARVGARAERVRVVARPRVADAKALDDPEATRRGRRARFAHAHRRAPGPAASAILVDPQPFA